MDTRSGTFAVDHTVAAAFRAERHGRRTLAWLGLILLVSARVVTAAAEGALDVFWTTQVLFLTPHVMAVGGTVLAARRTVGHERVFWFLIAGATGSLLASELLYVVWRVIEPSRETVPISGYALHGFALAFFLSLVVHLTRVGTSSVYHRLRLSLDVISLVFVSYAISMVFVVAPLLFPFSNVTLREIVTLSIYPVIGVAVLGGTFVCVFGPRASRWTPWERFVALGITVYALGVTLKPAWRAFDYFAQAEMGAAGIELLWMGGMYLIFMGATRRLSVLHSDWSLRPVPASLPPAPGLRAAVVPFAIVLVLPVLGWRALQESASGGERTLLVVTMAIVAIALTARSLIVALDNGHLVIRSNTDALTGLENRRAFEERLHAEVALAFRYREPLALVLLDLDDFARINDRFGHEAGDAFMREVACRLTDAAGPHAPATRMGGDEFAIILRAMGAMEALKVCTRIQVLLSQEVGIPGFPATASIGVGLLSGGADAAGLLRSADEAMYWVKHHGKDGLLVHDASVVSRAWADRDVRVALDGYRQTLRGFAAAVEERDGRQGAHGRSVAQLAARVARSLGLGDHEVADIELAAELHDVGMAFVPVSLMREPDVLDPAGRALLDEHAEAGARLCASAGLDTVADAVRAHHECWDGSGVPAGLCGEEIPLSARIIAACDMYDAMLNARPHRRGMAAVDAREELVRHAGRRLDPTVVSAVIDVLGDAA